MNSKEIFNQIRIVFHQMDTDNSGTLSRDEIKTGLQMIDFGLGSENENFAESIYQELYQGDEDEITIDDFIRWNFKKITSSLMHDEESNMASIFMSPAFEIIARLNKLKPSLTESQQADIDYCVEKIRSGKIYASGFSSQNMELSSQLKAETLQIIMFYSDDLKKERLIEDEKHSAMIAKKRSTYHERFKISEIEDLVSLLDINSSSFNIFERYESIQNVTRIMHGITDLSLKHWNLYNSLNIDYSTFLLFCYEISAGYSEKNPYHNNLHAADVVQNVHYLLKSSEIVSLVQMRPIHIFSILVAALIHDFKHPGLTNSYLEATNHEIASKFNDRSVLENFHISEAFAVTRKEECNIFEKFDRAEYSTARHIIIEAVLATDMAKHSECLNNLQNVVMNESLLAENKVQTLAMLLHASDISHPCREWEIHLRWTEMVELEFFNEGDREKEMGWSVIPLFDRVNEANIPNMQIGFINGVIIPFFKPLLKAIGAGDDLIENVNKNREKWSEYI